MEETACLLSTQTNAIRLLESIAQEQTDGAIGLEVLPENIDWFTVSKG